MAYNGWTNYETWNVALWIDNDQGSYSQRQEMAQTAYDDADGDTDEARRKLADALKDWIEEMNPLASDNSLFTDLLGAALGEVDWHEIAENFLEDVEKTEPDDDDDEDDDPEPDDDRARQALGLPNASEAEPTGID